MEIEQVRTALREVEAEIFHAVEKSIAGFREKTGLSLSAIDISFIRKNNMGERDSRLMVRDVIAEAQL